MNTSIKLSFALLLASTAHISYSVQKTAVFIIGMGRSGTSCTAGVLNILGMEMGAPLSPPCPNNQKGKFEHVPTITLNKPILKELGAVWWDPRLIAWDNLPRREILKDQVKEHLQQHFGNYTFFGIKNPEITSLLPLYTQAALELGYTPKIILVLRHPEETNASLKKDLGQPKKDYYKNIAIAYACALLNARGFDLEVVYFSDLIHHTQETVARLNKFLPQLKTYDQKQKELTEFIDSGLKHQNA